MQEIAVRKKPHGMMKQFLFDQAVLENLVYWLYEIMKSMKTENKFRKKMWTRCEIHEDWKHTI